MDPRPQRGNDRCTWDVLVTTRHPFTSHLSTVFFGVHLSARSRQTFLFRLNRGFAVPEVLLYTVALLVVEDALIYRSSIRGQVNISSTTKKKCTFNS
jgi:hypothetical protein